MSGHPSEAQSIAPAYNCPETTIDLIDNSRSGLRDREWLRGR
jgi:hypothetical protein